MKGSIVMTEKLDLARSRRMRTLIRSYAPLFPAEAFAALFRCPKEFVRIQKRDLGVTEAFRRIDRFARQAKFPSAPRLTTEERATLRAFWEGLRTRYTSSPRVLRLRHLTVACRDILPTHVIGRLFDVTGDAVLVHQRSLGLQRSAKESLRLSQAFVRRRSPPTLSQLTVEEQGKLAAIWREEKQARAARDSEDNILRHLYLEVPSVALGALFGLTAHGLRKRARDMSLPEIRGKAVTSRFLAHRAPPQFECLCKHQQKLLNESWRLLKESRVRELNKKDRALRKRMIARLNVLKKAYNGRRFAKCGSPECGRTWPHTKQFFGKNRSRPSGLDSRCRLCEQKRKVKNRGLAPKRKRRVFSREERQRFETIVRENAALIPSRLLEFLLNVNRFNLCNLRRNAKVKVSASQMRHLYVKWVLAEEMPNVSLSTEDTEKLRDIWKSEKLRYRQSVLEDDGRLGVQEAMKQEVLDRGAAGVQFLPCYGPYCDGKKHWPVVSGMFRRALRCKEIERRCTACDNLERRIATFHSRKAAG